MVNAPAEDVWARVVTPEGINHELAPWVRMTVPRGASTLDLDDVEPGSELGRSWLLLFGVVPFDWDDLGIAELEPGRRFLEQSTMLSMRSWTHEREVIPIDEDHCEVRDQIAFSARAPLSLVPGIDAGLERLVGRLFAHRHRRLAEFFGRPLGQPPGQPPM
jgi:ligand-binding SRPBCC domain-containing protein